MRPKKRLGKSHWKESRKEAANLNQKAGPMETKRNKRPRHPIELTEDDDFPTCQGCGVEISYVDVVDWNSYCEVCYNISGDEYEDTLEEESIPEPEDPSPKTTQFPTYNNVDLEVPRSKPKKGRSGEGDPR